jgi:hypothetical protein
VTQVFYEDVYAHAPGAEVTATLNCPAGYVGTGIAMANAGNPYFYGTPDSDAMTSWTLHINDDPAYNWVERTLRYSLTCVKGVSTYVGNPT